ncbi:T9SS type A sorting domain-containing protein [Polaribacter haliotis]|uniref:T9SS type A sorting domain-containing protein n=1 Tax=Polaribacter haliotis TaxID=1888915 RepID=A0A7L8AJ54_9FLAO|nr:T9SS type A sorting domain-containing protein [Polaribacter haliotis]QOD62003.1 T9SS type A sorting domain-containing protein [Polaribacter haliotis]
MKKLLLTICFLASLAINAQTFNFNTDGDNEGWSNLTVANGLASLSSGTSSSTTANVSATNVIVKITVKNLSGNSYLRVSNLKSGGSGREYENLYISTNDSEFKTYSFDMTGNDGYTGTVNDIKVHTKLNENDNATYGAGEEMLIDKIEFVPITSIDSKALFTFSNAPHTDFFNIITNSTSVVATAGKLIFTPEANANSKIRLSSALTVDATNNKYIHVRLKNNSATHNQVRLSFTSSAGTGGENLNISQSDADFKIYSYDLSSDANWTGNIEVLDFAIRNTGNTQNRPSDADTVEFDYIIFNNSATTPSVWIGDTNTTWSTGSNWNTGTTPTSAENVVIQSSSNTPSIGTSTGAETNNLDIISETILSISAGGSLKVNGTSSGKVTYNRTLTAVGGNTNGWHLLASPVVGQSYDNDYATANSLATSGTKRGLAVSYDDDAPTSLLKYTYLQDDDSNSGTFTSGKGYSVKRASTGNIAFTGTINTADVNGVTVSTAGNGFNLLGVPYTSYMSSQTFLTANTDLDQGQIWVWEQGATGGNFITMTTKTDNFILAPGQGFFVKATAATPVNFSKSNQQPNADTFKKSQSTRTEIKLLMTDGTNNRFAKFYYTDSATKGFDIGWDGETFGGIPNSLDVYSQLVDGNQGKNYQVQSLPNSDLENMIIPIGVTAAINSEVTFTAKAANLPKGYNVYLEDRLNSIVTLLDNTNSYKATVTDAKTNGRFFIHARTNSILSTDTEILNSVSIYKTSNENLKIIGLQKGKTTVSLFNILGKQVLNTSFEATSVNNIALPRLAKGVYMVNVQTENGKLDKKIILE